MMLFRLSIFGILLALGPVQTLANERSGWHVSRLNDLHGQTLKITRMDGTVERLNPKVAWVSNRGTHLSQLQFGVTCDPFEKRPMVVVDELSYLFETAPKIAISVDGKSYVATGRPNPNPPFANFGFTAPDNLLDDIQSGTSLRVTLNGAYAKTHSLTGSRDAIDLMLATCG